ncbi:hypothetical protein L3Q82_003721 [Scortum barcoo]|uniref:Uncharacterized protein n=1 Tax=Scortum barcoo TaxID=214431 RepID=A0ACB8X5S8_9TELE|nr:hypothetical protein L3Q82_003721 [Scortum barcoo]
MNGAIVMFLESLAKVGAAVESGVVIQGTFTPVLPLVSPAKKVIISNAPPFIKNEALIKELSRYGQTGPLRVELPLALAELPPLAPGGASSAAGRGRRSPLGVNASAEPGCGDPARRGSLGQGEDSTQADGVFDTDSQPHDEQHSEGEGDGQIRNVRVNSAYWHFNIALIHDKAFRAALSYFWSIHRQCKADFDCVQQWWDFGDRGLLESLTSKKAALANLLGVTAQGALVRSRFLDVSQMDAPSQFFFGLEKKNGQIKIFTRVNSTDNPEVSQHFYADLPQVDPEDNIKLEAGLSLAELHAALMSLQNGKAPGIDGLPVDFYKSFWSVLGEDLLEVIMDCLETGWLPMSCRRAVITLLPKKGDLQELKNWRPVLISDNVTLIQDVLEVTSSLAVDTGLISKDQEKAFDRVEHQYLWQTLAAFGFSSGFIAKIQVLYCDIESVLKINGGLSAPFSVQRGVRQGCSLSGMLYSLAIEPLLHKTTKRVLVDFFWDKLHWVPQSVLFLPKEEGGQGLVHLASRGAAFRLQFIQRLLSGPKDLVWRPLAYCILQRVGGLGLSAPLFLMDWKKVSDLSVPGFYRSVFTVWTLLRKQRRERMDSSVLAAAGASVVRWTLGYSGLGRACAVKKVPYCKVC